MSEVAIIDATGANIASLEFALSRLGAKSVLTSDPQTIRAAARVILPGVGAAADAMQRLRDRKLDTLVPQLTQPVLGICLGMQLLASASEENATKCLGLVPGVSRELAASPATPVPNMGWCKTHNTVTHPLLDGIESETYFYFVHSYALPQDEHTLAIADHREPFCAMLAHGNFAATQFHPERSAAAGAKVLQNFLEWSPCT